MLLFALSFGGHNLVILDIVVQAFRTPRFVPLRHTRVRSLIMLQFRLIERKPLLPELRSLLYVAHAEALDHLKVVHC